MTGASGLIGSALVRSLREDGHEVRRLVRRTTTAPDEVQWTPGVVAPHIVAGTDAVVHLAGAGIGDRRWTAAWQAEVLRSRVDGTTAIAGSIAACDDPPRTLLSGSAIGWYGDSGERPVDETAPSGEGFLADVVRRWEASTAAAERSGTRVVHLRTGIVLATKGGALGRALPLFRLGLGARLGSGRQWVSWISLPDEVAAIRFLLANEVVGPVNLTSPHPATNADYTAAIARAVRRPAVLAVPGAALRLAFGGFADEGLLAGQRGLPAVLERTGFRFALPTLDEALPALLGSRGSGPRHVGDPPAGASGQ